jgi:predicted CopG family antitoxin
MIKLKSLLETRIIDPQTSLSVGDITLYHGTNWEVAKRAKKGEMGPIDRKKMVINILMTRFGESKENAEKMYEKYATRKDEPNVLFLTTDKDQAIGYAKYTAQFGGEIVSDVLTRYIRDRKIPEEQFNRLFPSYEPAIVTVTVPLEMVLTHPYWSTSLKKRLLDIYWYLKKDLVYSNIW